MVCDFTENSCSKAILSISRNNGLLQFEIVKFRSCPIPIILTISCEIMQNFANFCAKNHEKLGKCHSRISRSLQMVNCEITFTFD